MHFLRFFVPSYSSFFGKSVSQHDQLLTSRTDGESFPGGADYPNPYHISIPIIVSVVTLLPGMIILGRIVACWMHVSMFVRASLGKSASRQVDRSSAGSPADFPTKSNYRIVVG